MFMKKLLPILLWSLFVFPSAGQQLQLVTYDIDEGLSRGLIKSVITDDIGFVWSATDEGVIRFDGQNSVFFRDFLPGGFAKSFHKRANGQFLVAHDRGVLEIISKPDTAYFREFLPGSTADTDTALYYPKILYEDDREALWIGEQQSVVRYADGQFNKYRFPAEDRALSFERNFAFAEDGRGTLWTASFNGNLYFFDRERDRFVPVEWSIAPSDVSFMTAVDSSRLLLGAREGVFEVIVHLEERTVEAKRIAAISRASCGLQVNGHEFYVGTFDDGLYRGNLEEEQLQLTRVEPLSFPDIMTLYFDGNGLWVCSSEAIGLLHPVFFGKFHLNGEIDQVSSLELARDSSIVATNGGQVFILEPKGERWEKSEVITFPGDKAALQAVKTGEDIWIGGFTGEVYRYDPGSRRLTSLPGISLHHSYLVSDMMVDRRGNVWVCGNRRDGLIRIADDRQIFKYGDGGLSENSAIAESPEGRIFCAGRGIDRYLFRYDTGNDRFDNVSVPLPFETGSNFVIYDLFFEREQSLLLASSHGLLRYQYGDSVRVERLDVQAVPVEEPVHAIERTPDGALWVAATRGLVKFEEDNSLLFDPTSGLPSRTLKQHAMITDFSGDLWVGTARGLAFYTGGRHKEQRTNRPIFTEIKVGGRKVNYNRNLIRAFPHRSSVEVSYIALAFPGDRIKYQYRIPEQDTTWSAPLSGTQLFFDRLEAGEYTLEIRARQNSGLLWSTPRSYRFEIAPPWYLHWWAVLLFAIGGFGLFVSAVRLYNLNLIRQKQRLEKIVAERTEEIRQQNGKIIAQKNEIIQHKEELIRQGEIVLETQMALSNAERKNRLLKEKQLKQALEYKNKQLTTVSLRIVQKNKTLKDLSKKVKAIANSSSPTKRELRALQKLIDESFRLDRDWDEFKLYFEQVYVDFYQNLNQKYPDLTSTELRHCALIKLNLSISECANILGISPESVKISRFRLKKKMNLETQNEVRDRIMSI